MNAFRRIAVAVRTTSLVGLVGCGGSSSSNPSDPPGSTPVPDAPLNPADVQTTYAKLGKACGSGGYVMRSLSLSPSSPSNFWSVPKDDPGAIAAPRTEKGWGPIVTALELGVEEIAEQVETEGPEQAARCASAREIFSPMTENGRAHFLNVLLFPGDHARPDTWSAESVPASVHAPVRLRAYLDAASGVLESGGSSSDIVYRDVKHQFIPVYLRCDHEMTVGYEPVQLEGSAYRSEKLDSRLCRPVAGGADAYTCLYERIEAIEGTCSFVVVGATYQTNAGKEQRLSLGGRIEPGSRAYRITVDRFSFH